MSFSSAGIDAVLQAPPPPFSAAQACEIGRAAFGIEAVSARSLGSERDQAFLLAGASGAGTAVLKVSNPAENPAVLDMEALAALHAARCDPGLAVAQPRRRAPTGGLSPASAGGPAAFRGPWRDKGTGGWVRACDGLPGP